MQKKNSDHVIEEFQVKQPYEAAMNQIPHEAHSSFDRQFEYYKKYCGAKFQDPFSLNNRIILFDDGFFDYLKDAKKLKKSFSKATLSTKDKIKVNRSKALQSFTRLMLTLSMMNELIKNSTQYWKLFFKSYSNWCGNSIMRADTYNTNINF